MPDTAPPPVVMFDQVTVAYGNQQALRAVTGGFAAGAAGLLGPNGAGKSTLLKSLLGFVRPTSGSMRVLGLDVAAKPLEVRARLGYMPESDAHIPGMNAVTFVAYCARLAGLPPTDATQRAHEVLFYVGLGEARYRDIGTYSTGMRQRIKLAQALVHDPDLLFLDEPTNGMDPQGREEMLELMRDITQNKGINLILSSHLLADVEATCERVLVLNKGAIVAEGPIQELKGTTRRAFEIRIKGNLERFRDALAVAGLECDETLDDVMRVRISDDRGAKDLFALAAANDAQVRHLRPFVSTLEDVFARAIGEE
jgi:ABC-2 type transport system ATP-binding protein